MADTFCNFCVFGHFPVSPSGSGYTQVGQNLFVNTLGMNLEYGMSLWAAEKSYYTYNTNHCTAGQMCGHYKAMVWSSTKQIGCGHIYCPVLNNSDYDSGFMLACNYGPIGNYPAQLPYLSGAPCTSCPPGYQCRNGLCANDCSTDNPCDCMQVCSHGTLNADCECKCHDGYMGPACDDVCLDVRPECYVYWPPFFCTYGEITAHTHEDCTHMCNLCVSKCDVVASNCVNGQKIIGNNKYTDCSCQCNKNYSGVNCDFDVCAHYTDNCVSPGGYFNSTDVCRCQCKSGYSGDLCEIGPPTTMTDENFLYCSALRNNAMCGAGGHVVEDNGGECSCQCYTQYSGQFCNVSVCEVLTNNATVGCRPGGKVITDNNGNCSCECYNQYDGPTCKDLKVIDGETPKGVVSITYVEDIIKDGSIEYMAVLRSLRYQSADTFNTICRNDVRRCCIGAETQTLPSDTFTYVTSVFYTVSYNSYNQQTTFIYYANDIRYDFCAKATMGSFPNFNPQ